MTGTSDLKAGSELEPQGGGTPAGLGSPNLGPKAVENNAVFDQAMARIMGSRLGIYDGHDWAGPTPEARHLIGEQMLEEAVRLRETGRLVEGLALAIKIGKEQPLEPAEAVSQLKNGIDALGPGDVSGMGSLSSDLSQGAPPDASSGPPMGKTQHVHHGTPPADEPQLAAPEESLDHGGQLGFEGWAAVDPDDQEG